MVKMTQNIFVGSILKIKTVIQTVDYLGTEPCGGLGGIITVLLEGGNTEDVTTGWPENWTRAIGGASAPPLYLECTLSPPFPQ